MFAVLSETPCMAIDLDRQPNFAALLGLAWLIATMVLLLMYWPSTAQTLLDTDDAMRLVQFRSWLGGPGLLSGWYDMHQARLQPPAGIEMHWSRLIDAGLAVLYGLFRLFTEPFVRGSVRFTRRVVYVELGTQPSHLRAGLMLGL